MPQILRQKENWSSSMCSLRPEPNMGVVDIWRNTGKKTTSPCDWFQRGTPSFSIYSSKFSVSQKRSLESLTAWDSRGEVSNFYF